MLWGQVRRIYQFIDQWARWAFQGKNTDLVQNQSVMSGFQLHWHVYAVQNSPRLPFHEKCNKKWQYHYFNLDQSKYIHGPFAFKCSVLHTIEHLNTGKPQAVEAVICASKHLLLSLGPSGGTSSSLFLQCGCFRHDMPLNAIHHRGTGVPSHTAMSF